MRGEIRQKDETRLPDPQKFISGFSSRNGIRALLIGQIRFPGAERAAGEDGEAAGLPPGKAEDEAGGHFHPEKPCFPLLTEGIPGKLRTIGKKSLN